MNGGLDKRYARALAGAARSAGRIEEVADELAAAARWLLNAELAAALASPTIPHTTRASLLAELGKALDLSDLTRNFLSLLVENHRIGEIQGIELAYQTLVDHELGRVRATLHTARPLPEASTEEIRKGLSKAHGLEVLLSAETDESLIGGVTVEIQGRVYDGSVSTQLVELARTLTRGESAS
ncbi:MAG: ATP synthase F1 subunit delta [Deltaproteobacteria bacterium]